MALKTPYHKLKSSFGLYEFTCRDLLLIQDNFDWDLLSSLPDPTIRTHKEYEQMFTGMRLSVLGYHIEIMKETLYEYTVGLDKITPRQHLDHITMLIDFLSLLRNALIHTKGKLIPIWKNKDKTRLERIKKSLFANGLIINIPYEKVSGGMKFSEKSRIFYNLKINVELDKKVCIDEIFMHKIRLLSWHVFTIIKKRKTETLSEYLKHVLDVEES